MGKGREGSDGSTMEFRELLGRSVQVGVDSHVSKKAAGVAKETLPRITAEELARHNTEEDLWICVRGVAYDLSCLLYTSPSPRD